MKKGNAKKSVVKKKVAKKKAVKVKPKQVKKVKHKKVVSKIKKTKKKFIWFVVGTAVFAGLLLLNLLFVVANAPIDEDLALNEGLASLKGLGAEKWCNGADVSKNGAVDIFDVYLARQNNWGSNVKKLYLVSVNLGRTDCRG